MAPLSLRQSTRSWGFCPTLLWPQGPHLCFGNKTSHIFGTIYYEVWSKQIEINAFKRIDVKTLNGELKLDSQPVQRCFFLEHSSSSGKCTHSEHCHSDLGKNGCLTSAKDAQLAWVRNQGEGKIAARSPLPPRSCHVSTALENYILISWILKGLTLLLKNCSSLIMFSDERGKLGISRGSSLTFCLLNVCLNIHTHRMETFIRLFFEYYSHLNVIFRKAYLIENILQQWTS